MDIRNPISTWRAGMLAAAVLLIAAMPLRGAQAAADAGEPAKYVGKKKCAECHDTENKLFGHTQHSNAFTLNPRNDVEKQVCEACHGPGSKHVQNTKDKD